MLYTCKILIIKLYIIILIQIGVSLFPPVSEILNKGCDFMKKTLDKIYRKVVMSVWFIPIPVLLIIMALLNYWLGSTMSHINMLYSNIESLTKAEFIQSIIKLVGLWIIIKSANSIFSRLTNHRMLDRNYMKWIEKLTYSKVSSITSLGTGGLHNAIGTIAQCDKAMTIAVVGTLPYIMPFILVCKNEYEAAGIIPVLINVGTMIAIIALNFIVVNLRANKISAKAGADMHSVTVDCIHNSRTVKYFQKEKWSVDRQKNKQKEVFVDFINLKKINIRNILNILAWIPTINVVLCWDNKATVLFVLMSDYAIECIANSISDILDIYSDKKANLKILGTLEPDTNKKVPLEILRIKDIIFKYSKDSKVTFKIDDITIEKGKRYCITGKSGFGKSTFIKLVTRTVEPDIARAQIDSIDCIYMFAESEMFNTSVYDNVVLGDDSVTESEVKDILEHLEVVLDMDIMKDPVGEKGEKLSTGQMQRINLARVIVYARRHPGVLVALDEVTSALDEVTSINCINYLASEFERLGTTLLYVSNKSDYKNTNLITDNIYVERNGDIVTYVQK